MQGDDKEIRTQCAFILYIDNLLKHKKKQKKRRFKEELRLYMLHKRFLLLPSYALFLFVVKVKTC